jgi:hypothetical protein
MSKIITHPQVKKIQGQIQTTANVNQRRKKERILSASLTVLVTFLLL